MSEHTFQKQINFVQEFLHSRAIPFETEPKRWGPVITTESIRFNFNKNNINVYRKKVNTHGEDVDWDWAEQLFVPGDEKEEKAVDDYIRESCCIAHYVFMARGFTKAPEWIEFTVYTREAQGHENAVRIGIQAWVKLNRLGQTPYYKFLAGHDYFVVNNSFHDPESDRVVHHNFNNMTLALGSPVGQSYTDGHAPEAEGNFLTDGPFTFVPARATIHVASNYVLPEVEKETWPIWILIRSHDVKMCVETAQ